MSCKELPMKKYAFILFLLLWIFNYKLFAAPKFELTSSAFSQNAMIPAEYTCDGANHSPPLAWNNAPEKTQSFVLIVDDPNAPNGLFTHWILINIPSNLKKLEAGTLGPQGAMAIKNSSKMSTYYGPCPQLGAHRYVFKLYAIDKTLNLPETATKDEILNAITSHVLAESQLAGLYQKITNSK